MDANVQRNDTASTTTTITSSIDEDGHPSAAVGVTAPYQPCGDQPKAIEKIVQQLEAGNKHCVLRGLTGTGKTFVMSHVIARRNQPALVLCPTKTLAAQVARELRRFLGHHSVELFVSYYDHYVPESYKESTGTYVAKKSSVNSHIDALRHSATRSLVADDSRNVVVVASVSCIYGLGLPTEYLEASIELEIGHTWNWDDLIDQFESTMLYTETGAGTADSDGYGSGDDDLHRGMYEWSRKSDGN